VARVPLFRALTDASPDPYSIPLYEPTTEHERGMVAMFTKALEAGRPVDVEYRESAFFGTTGSRRASASSEAASSGCRPRRHPGGGARRLDREGTGELGRRRWRVEGLPSAGC
jgi:hypothetical protein